MAKPRKPADEKYQKLTVTVPPDLMAAIMAESEREERTLSDIVTRMLKRATGEGSISSAPSVDLSQMRDEIAAAIQKQTDQYIAATEKLGNNISSHMQEGFNSLGNGIERINQRLPSLPAGQQRIIMQEPEPDQGPRNEAANVIIDVVVDGEPAPVTETPDEKTAHVTEKPTQAKSGGKHPAYPELVDRLDQYLKQEKMSTKGFQERHGFGISNKAGWRNGSKGISREMMDKICTILDDAGIE